MYLVISCGSNSYPSCFGELLYVASWVFYLQMCCSALGVLSDHIDTVLFCFLVNKNPSGTFHTWLPHGISETLDICILPYFLSCRPNKMTVLFTSCLFMFVPALTGQTSRWQYWNDTNGSSVDTLRRRRHADKSRNACEAACIIRRPSQEPTSGTGEKWRSHSRPFVTCWLCCSRRRLSSLLSGM